MPPSPARARAPASRRFAPLMTPRQANLLTLLGLLSLLVVVSLTAPRWARFLRQPLGTAEDEPAVGGASMDPGPPPRAGEAEAELMLF